MTSAQFQILTVAKATSLKFTLGQYRRITLMDILKIQRMPK